MTQRIQETLSIRSKSIVPRGRIAAAAGRRLGPLTVRSFAVFYAGYAASLLGSAMSAVALTFAVLGSGRGASDLGLVFAARVVPLVLIMTSGGVLADRAGRRRVMLSTDALRLVVQAGLAAALLAGPPALWLLVSASALLSTGEGLFTPALGGLRVQIVPRSQLADASALLGVAESGAAVAGPALAGVLIWLTSPAVVIAIDAASFGISVLSLAALRIAPAAPPAQSPWRDLAEGWRVFRSQTALWLISVQFTVFNLLTWAPYLLLGPVLARQYLGGARAWGIIATAMAAGSVLTGLALVGRRPRAILVVAITGTFGYALPCLALAVRAGLPVVAAAAFAAGAGSTVLNTYHDTALQQRVAPGLLGRVTALSTTGAYALGAVGYAVIGPVAAHVGAARLLGFSAAYSAVSSALMLTAPAIRKARWIDVPAQRGGDWQDEPGDSPPAV